MRCLVTGGSGFVGANLARRLLSLGHEVHLFLRANRDWWRLDEILPKLRTHYLDVGDEKLGSVIQEIKPQWIFHLAAYGAYSWQDDLQQMVRTNIQGTMNLVRACTKHGFESFVNAGSSSEYGYKDHPPAETECPEPNSHYALTKVAATMFCQHTARKEGVPITTLRLYSAFGPYEDPNRLMPTLIAHGLKGGLPPLVAPETARDYVFIDDVVDAFLLAAGHQSHNPGAIYNLGTGIQTNLRQVVEVARRVMSINGQPEWGSMPSRHWDTTCWVADNRLIVRELGWAPRRSFEQGFQEMTNWYKRRHDTRSA